jgi:hypothetical protein
LWTCKTSVVLDFVSAFARLRSMTGTVGGWLAERSKALYAAVPPETATITPTTQTRSNHLMPEG